MLQKTSWWRKPPYNWHQKCSERGSLGSGASCASGARILQAEELAGVWAFPSSHGASALPGTHTLPEFVTLSTALVISLPTQGDVWWLYPEGFCVDFTLYSFTAYLWLQINTWVSFMHFFWASIIVTQRMLSRSVVSTLYDTMDCSPPGSSVLEILQAEILEWVSISFSRGSSWSRDWTQVSCLARFFTIWTAREAHSLMRVLYM